MENYDFNHTLRQIKPLTIGEWLITLLIQSIPIIGFIMLFVWAFGDNTHPSKKSYAQASLIFLAIIFILAIVFVIFMGGLFISLFEEMNYNYST